MNLISYRRKYWNRPRHAVGLVLLGMLMTASVGRAQISNVAWKAAFSGGLTIQRFDAGLNPRQTSANFGTRNLLKMASGTAPGKNTILAVSLGFVPDTNAISVTISEYDTVTREIGVTIGSSASGVAVSDGKNFVFTADIDLRDLRPTTGNLRGGHLRMAGRGTVIRGAPVRLLANVEGFLVDQHPTDLQGTTGLITRATIQTLGAPLRVQPPVVP